MEVLANGEGPKPGLSWWGRQDTFINRLVTSTGDFPLKNLP